MAKKAEKNSSYSGGAKILSIGIASTGLVTFAYFSFASHLLPEAQYGDITKLWILMFIVLSVIYRPVEQLLSRTIAKRRSQGIDNHNLLVPVAIQAAFTVIFVAAALLLRDPIQNDLLGGSSGLYWILVVGVTAYGASYFTRGWLAGNQLFGLYGGLVLLESCSRFAFVLAAAIGISEGQIAIALGVVAAPFASLLVLPLAVIKRRSGSLSSAKQDEYAAADTKSELTLRSGSSFATAVFLVMLAEQVLINAGPLFAGASAADAALTGLIFNLLLITRAPLQLFQSVQTSLLPHLAGLDSKTDRGEISRAIRLTVLAILGFAAVISIGLLAVGPLAMEVLFGGESSYGRVTLALVGCGMGMHLVAGTLNQAALASGRAAAAAASWIVAATAFSLWVASDVVVNEPMLRVASGYVVACTLLVLLLTPIYRYQPKTLVRSESHSS